MRKNNKGFTLIEMLIVVAIIAILVAVSIPLVNTSLERARKATDAANERAAKAEAIIMWMNNDAAIANNYYHADTGEINDTSITGDSYGKCADHKDQYLTVNVSADGEVTLKWSGSDVLHNGTVTD